jgi:hypothetical protein
MTSVRVRFASGSLLLEGLSPDYDLGCVPGVEWDPRARAHRAPARAYFALAVELRHRGVPMTTGKRPKVRPAARRDPPGPRAEALRKRGAWD